MEVKLLNSLLQSQSKGYQADSGAFKATAWNVAIEAVRPVSSGQTLNIQKMKSKYDTLKTDWKAWRHFLWNNRAMNGTQRRGCRRQHLRCCVPSSMPIQGLKNSRRSRSQMPTSFNPSLMELSLPVTLRPYLKQAET